MITCLGWIKRGVAKAAPDKVTLSKEELQEIIDEAKEKLKEKEEAEKEAENSERKSAEEVDQSKPKSSAVKSKVDDDDITDLYDMEHYDSDEDLEGELMSGAGMAGVTFYASNKDDPYITLQDPDKDEDETEDFNIKPDDNLIVAGHVDQDFSTLEISVYNEEEGSQYVHHDILLEAFPLAIEWLDFDPEDTSKPANFVAIGSMEPYIDIWDLDLVDTLEPVVSLGKRKRKKSKKKSRNSEEGHSDAVLDLSWNHLLRNVLASASADHSVILWDLSQPKPVHILRHHKDKVQSLQWHPYESQSILTGSFDKKAKVLDCRSPESNIKSWKFDAEVERVLWNHFSPYNFLVSTETGHVFCCDVRTDTPVFTLKAHDDAIPGLALSSQVPGCLVTASADETVKVWDIQDNQPSFVVSRGLPVGKILNASCCPDAPFVFCFGGEKQGLRVFDITESSPVRRQFESRQRLVPTAVKTEAETVESLPEAADDAVEGEVKPEPMEEESAANAMAALSLSGSTNSGHSKKKKKKKRK
ncbi:rRNA-processing protein [Desmophyllum pertusum]|uniref:rRNA-processing protein n=1 Tax=Desmophyllum pertusum TaxID=174260 RepID=A0A9W9ZCP5_9CNID|nr:rRNA-processing protein [Desmophyllum pertusum]